MWIFCGKLDAVWMENSTILYNLIGISEVDLMVKPHQTKSEYAKATTLCWVLIISSLPATPSEGESDVTYQLGSKVI